MMPQLNELICPSTGEPCQFSHLCASSKETIEEGGTIGGPAAMLLEESVTAAYVGSFCVNERLSALMELADDPDNSEQVQHQAETMALGLDSVRTLFITRKQ